MSAGQDECVSQVGQTDDTLIAVVAVLIIRRLEKEKKTKLLNCTYKTGND